MDNQKRSDNNDELIIGRNAILEALKSERAINTLFVAKGERNGSVGRIIAQATPWGVSYRADRP